MQSLEAHERRVIRIDLGTGIVSGLGEVLQALEAATVEVANSDGRNGRDIGKYPWRVLPTDTRGE